MGNWASAIDFSRPYWADYHELFARLPGDGFPGAGSLNDLLPVGIVNRNTKPIQFVPASLLGEVNYEKHIFESGQISTRENNWHDLFNAFVWCRLPTFKSAMNALHHDHLGEEKNGRRGRVRDALTLLDESGVIVLASNRELLQALAARDWIQAFVTMRDAWQKELRIIICGHALLEKFLSPYKAVTAHALLLYAEQETAGLSLPMLDSLLSDSLLSGQLLGSRGNLSPLPLMGIPGWAREQDQVFYDDLKVFRPARSFHRPGTVQVLSFSA